MNLFQNVKVNRPKRSLFDMSHEVKTSFNMGELIPVYLQEIVPGDKFRVNSEMLIRFPPMIAPVMHRIQASLHFFFVPNRLVWDNWETFITGGEQGNDASVLPRLTINEADKAMYAKGTLYDYFGLPVPAGTITDDLKVSALPFRAYQKIWEDYYRNQNFQTKVGFATGDTVDEPDAINTIKFRNWEKDYFTSALPWTQRSSTSLSITGVIDYDETSVALKTATGLPPATGNLKSEATTGHLQSAASEDLYLANLDGITIPLDELRRTEKLARWMEINAIVGGRYDESILGHFGVSVQDFRLQKTEFLGGGRVPIVVSEVLNTSATATEAQGEMAGHGIGVGMNNGFKRYFYEHGYVLGILSVIPKTAYQQGVDKHWLRTDKTEFYWPEFANLGEQQIIKSEIYHPWTGSSGAGDDLWAYQSRYAEMKQNFNKVMGDFRDNLSYWHMGRIFTSAPDLNSAFVTADPTYRIFADTSTAVDHVYCQLYHRIKALRPMPYFNSPSII